MNEAICLKIINLTHRNDRRAECMDELQRAGVPASPEMFFKARHAPDFGAMGCALSHAMLLSDFLFSSDKEFVLVLEDDFQIQDYASFLGTSTGPCSTPHRGTCSCSVTTSRYRSRQRR